MAIEPETARLDELDREELEELVCELHDRVETLEDKVQKNERKPSRTVINNLFSALTGAEVENFDASPYELRQDAEDVHQRLASIERDVQELRSLATAEETLTGDETVANWRKIVRQAANLKDHREHGMPDNHVKLFKKQIAGAVGCTERHALNLIDRYADPEQLDYDGVEKQPYKQFTTSRKTESSGVQEKALIVDLDVWESEIDE